MRSISKNSTRIAGPISPNVAYMILMGDEIIIMSDIMKISSLQTIMK